MRVVLDRDDAGDVDHVVMAQRNSEYARIARDDYATPDWVTLALLSVETFRGMVWECAPGRGDMANVLAAQGIDVLADNSVDFLETNSPFLSEAGNIVTNPPYGLADEFCYRALELTESCDGKVAMLLPHAFDAAKGRIDIFRDCSAFKAKYTLLRRIRWANLEQKAAGPSTNHAWYVWDWKHRGPATMGWLT